MTCREFAERTRDYWNGWVRRLSIAYDWQDAIIRAAIALKLSNFEETGGIVAALTTSIPEAPGSGRTWDYRYCWLRDAYFVVKALNRLGASKTMEGFISFILGIASEEVLRPVYGVVPTSPSTRQSRRTWQDIAMTARSGSATPPCIKLSTTTFGSIILAAMPMFFDRRLPRQANEGLFLLLEGLGFKAAKLAFEPDAGIWEYRGRSHVHTYSAAMCWAGCSRLAAIAAHLGLDDSAAHWAETANDMQTTLLERPGARSATPSPQGSASKSSIRAFCCSPRLV